MSVSAPSPMRETAEQRATRIRLSSARKARSADPRPGRSQGPRADGATVYEQGFVKKESAVAVPM